VVAIKSVLAASCDWTSVQLVSGHEQGFNPKGAACARGETRLFDTEPNVGSAYSIETFAWDQDGNLLIKTYYPMPEHIGADEDPYAPLLDPRQDDARPG
jgi:hypothetical protein